MLWNSPDGLRALKIRESAAQCWRQRAGQESISGSEFTVTLKNCDFLPECSLCGTSESEESDKNRTRGQTTHLHVKKNEIITEPSERSKHQRVQQNSGPEVSDKNQSREQKFMHN